MLGEEGCGLDKLAGRELLARLRPRVVGVANVSFSSVVVAGAAPRVRFAGVSSSGGEGLRLTGRGAGFRRLQLARRLRWGSQRPRPPRPRRVSSALAFLGEPDPHLRQ